MGAWGHTSFENDDAMDWLGDLQGATDPEPIADAFAAVLEADD